MRQGLVVFSLFLTTVIVGCGGSGAFKGSAQSASVSVGSSSTTGTSNSGSSTSTSASSATTPPSGSSSTSGSNTTASNSAGTSAGSSSSSSTPTSGAEVAITSPADGANVSSPAQVSTSVSGSTLIAATQLYVDSAMSFQAASPQVSTALPLSPGAHTLVAQVWDQNGNAFKSAPVHIMVGEAASGQPAPVPAAPAAAPSAPAPNAAEIQTQGGWDSCGACAGHGGAGPDSPHSMQEGISSPSLSGSSARFDVGPSVWGAALYWKELGSHDEAQNLTYNLDFYIDDSVANTQALEFDVNQTTGGSKYIFGTECDFRASGTWRVWNGPAATWVSTGIACPMPQANTWHHLTWELQRSGGQTHFIAVTLDGNRQSVGMGFDGIGQSGSGLDVAFQADLMASGANVTVWLDNVSLSW